MLACCNDARWYLLFAIILLGGCSTADVQVSLETSSLTHPTEQRPYAANLKAGGDSFARSDYGLAEREFRAAVESNPTNVSGWLGLAASYDRLRRFDLADRAYEQALRLGGRTPQYLNNRGYHYLLMGNRKRADEYLREAVEQDPHNPYITGNMKLVQTWTGAPQE